MKTSLFDLFKIGIGPSSSHTVGPMRAAGRFASALASYPSVTRVRVELYGSLALTGRGHGTDRAILLGLSGEEPDRVDPAAVDGIISGIRASGTLRLAGNREVPFSESSDLLFHMDLRLPGHSNGMRFVAFGSNGEELIRKVYYSVGGGFIVEEGESQTAGAAAGRAPVPHSFESGAELLAMCDREKLAIWQLMLENEKAWRSEEEVRSGILRIWQTMRDCTARGLVTEGILPGGLNVRRRAVSLRKRFEQRSKSDSLAPMDWANLYAIAVNEENAAGGRVVTAPTNGAAGVIPAVTQYYANFLNGDEDGVIRFFLAAAAIGVLYKEHASISGAEVGCQGEVGVACSMAAAGLVAAQNGGNRQIEHAAEIGMEHNLGMTCDPIGGLVQIPCIERNAFGAVKAINAARMAIEETTGHIVSLDQVIRTMYQTGLDMQSKYKETALAGLAVNVVEC